ncbi:MoxR family ATPase [Candidatus Sumerlaeota bacterium]|nr:MoxR family ATPase [Candidatus Sumerlaeota bacterium]
MDDFQVPSEPVEAAPSPRRVAAPALDAEKIQQIRQARDQIYGEIAKIIIGQQDVVEQVLTAMLCRSHCLVVGVPGLAKTLMVRTVAQVLQLQFKRIQFTPDLMPSDIIGTDILEEDQVTRQRSFKFIKGPVFANIVLADEINRTPPKTQAALLEAMQEYHVTTGGTTYELPLPFFVLATQNPIEQEGTYPLPEAQLDRFMFEILIDYPDEEAEKQIVRATTRDQEQQLRVVMGSRAILQLQAIVRQMPVSEHVVTYATRLVRASRPRNPNSPKFIKDWVSWGAGPRACQYLILGAKARALLDGRVSVSCDDVRAMAPAVLRHRIFTNFNADAEGVSVEDVVGRLLETVAEPSESDYR